ncbi:hypothetical protein KP509_04G004100 [Ceratopteris richardii]|uniref:Major facilitator superfamily (MFS) profile domain-containing protein n=1 Tax=Ceratopteris richardii TaxID=49495 RepID=A0A8T2UX85_CERRI|nr:hypothetical protein KP509_04G004100 [Ceratopteris richardii]
MAKRSSNNLDTAVLRESRSPDVKFMKSPEAAGDQGMELPDQASGYAHRTSYSVASSENTVSIPNLQFKQFEQEQSELEDDSESEAPFSLPVDSENKAKKIKFFSAAKPHMRAFHLSWFSFFACFMSSFAAAPLLPVIRDNIDLTKQDIGNAGTASVAGSVLSRLIMGALCDIVGPRYACAFLVMLTAPAVFSMASVSTAAGFLVSRFCIGFSLATFVTCQYWMSSMFSAEIVGTVNGCTAGWANLGGGAALFIMPLIYHLFQHPLACDSFVAWRLAMFVPGMVQVASGLMVLYLGQDLPDGNFRELKEKGKQVKDSWSKVIFYAITNSKTWVFALAYGYSFGIELTIDNIISQYFYDRFSLPLHTSGVVASVFGLMNIISRPFGGFLSDWSAQRLGMRGRLWTLWISQTIGGLFCFLLGRLDQLGPVIVVMVFFSIFAEAAAGATFGIIPFISRRSLGVISGTIGAGGTFGAILTQLIFFTSPAYSTETGISLMGIMIVCCTVPIMGIYFPQWGGMLWPPSKSRNATEEKYYLSEWSKEEQEKGMHLASLKFAENTRGERGRRITPSTTNACAVTYA